jgi:dTDP-glucose 4,6-dehydratase
VVELLCKKNGFVLKGAAMKILITGGTTFVSKYAAKYFVTKGDDVTVINRGSRAQVNGVTHINCDRTALGDRLNGWHFDLILDITAYTEEHIKTLLDSGVSFDNYIFISSSAVYPETNPQPFTEEQFCGYNSVWGDYGMNKLKVEQFLQAKAPNAYILRPPYFYGVYENLYREAFPFDCAMQDRPFYIPQNGDMKLQFFNVSDLCRFVEILIDKHPKDHVFNVGNKDVVTVKEWVELCYKAAGKTAEFISIDKEIPQRDYFCFYDYEYVLGVSEQDELMPDTVSLEQGLKEEFEWYKNNINSIYNRKPYIQYIDKNLKRFGKQNECKTVTC